MRNILKAWAFAVLVLPFLFCSCASSNHFPPQLPPEITLNQSAGRGDWVRLNLHLADGTKLSGVTPDTGGYRTVLDKSFEPSLGKRLGERLWLEPFLGGLVTVGLYKAPKLYLGGVPLVTGSCIYTYDFHKIAPHLDGILGVDCLRHYCIQLDFTQGKMRFLDPSRPDNTDLGTACPVFLIGGILAARADLFGTGKHFFCPDTGCQACDAMLTPRLLRKLSKKEKPVWSGEPAGISPHPNVSLFWQGAFAGQTYTNLTFFQWQATWPAFNLVGLPFFARNLVTFNFPKRTMYLKRQREGPLNAGLFMYIDVWNFWFMLRESGRLPGWAKNEDGDCFAPPGFPVEKYPYTVTFTAQKSHDPSTYHYTMLRQTKDAPWQLQKAWQTDAKDQLIQEYPLPSM